MNNFLRLVAPKLKLAVQAAALVAATIFGGSAHADIVTLKYSSYINLIDPHTGGASKISGYLFFDTSQPAQTVQGEYGSYIAFPVSITQSSLDSFGYYSEPVNPYTGETLPNDSPYQGWFAASGYDIDLSPNGYILNFEWFTDGDLIIKFNLDSEGVYNRFIWYTSGGGERNWNIPTNQVFPSYPSPEISLYSVTPSTVTAVPEPASWALMLAGLGVAGSMAARRRKAHGENTTVA